MVELPLAAPVILIRAFASLFPGRRGQSRQAAVGAGGLKLYIFAGCAGRTTIPLLLAGAISFSASGVDCRFRFGTIENPFAPIV